MFALQPTRPLMFSSFSDGFSYPLRGLKLLWHPKLRAFVWLPVLINTVFFAGGIYWLSTTLYAKANDAIVSSLPSWLQWLSWLVVPLLIVAFALLLFYGFTIVANILASPFNGFLSERVEDALAPTNNPRVERSLAQEVVVSVAGELRKLGYYLARAIPLAILLFIPGINLFSPLVWALVGAWMLALQYLDYPLGNHGLIFPQQRKIAKRRLSLTLGFGCCVLLMTLIPVLNFLSMPASVIGATLLTGEKRLLTNEK
jgi:CysZ protein